MGLRRLCSFIRHNIETCLVLSDKNLVRTIYQNLYSVRDSLFKVRGCTGLGLRLVAVMILRLREVLDLG